MIDRGEKRGSTKLNRTMFEAIGVFLRWWQRELLACVPTPVRGLFAGFGARAAIEVEADAIVLLKRERLAWRECGRVIIVNRIAEEVDQDLIRMVEAADLVGSRTGVRLGTKLALRRTLWLPAAAGTNLRQVLAFEMDRFTPFAADQVYFDGRVVKADSENNRVNVELTFTTRRVVDELIHRARTWHLVLASFGTVHDAIDASKPAYLRSEAAAAGRQGGAGPSWALSGALAAVLLVLLFLGALLPLWNKQRQLALYEAQLDRIRTEALLVATLRDELVTKQDAATFLQERKATQRTMLALWQEATHLLPDSTWLLLLRVDSRDILMSGYSDDPSSLIEILEESPQFEAVQFSSPVTLDLRVGLERFNLVAKIEQETVP